MGDTGLDAVLPTHAQSGSCSTFPFFSPLRSNPLAAHVAHPCQAECPEVANSLPLLHKPCACGAGFACVAAFAPASSTGDKDADGLSAPMMAGQPADEGPDPRQPGGDAGPEQRAGNGAGSLWAGTPAATGAESGAGSGAGALWAGTRAAAGSGAAPDELSAGSAARQGSLWAGTPSGAADRPADAEPDLARGGLFAGTPAGAREGGGGGDRGAAQGAVGALAAAAEPGHLLDFVRDGASMLIRSAVLQARRTAHGTPEDERPLFLGAHRASARPAPCLLAAHMCCGDAAHLHGLYVLQLTTSMSVCVSHHMRARR